MTANATLSGVFLKGTAAARPAANAVAGGTVYSATDTGVITQSDGSSWSTWATISSGIADPTTTRGDFLYRGAASLGRLALGASGKSLESDGTDALWRFPPGYEFDYAQFTSNVNITATTDATANTVVTGNAVAYDGSTVVMIEFSSPDAISPGINNAYMVLVLYDGSTSIAQFGGVLPPAGTNTIYTPVRMARRLTPSNASHTYSVRAFVSSGTGVVAGGAGTNGVNVPGFLRITKV